jgi:FKBP-type peptidyl-prolyl cis-trans isomerase FkpA
MKLRILVVMAGIFMLASCTQDAAEETTSTGFKYKLMSEGGEEKAKDGEYVFFHVDMKADNTEQFNSRTSGQESMVQLKEQPNTNVITNALQEVLMKSAIGDSLVLMIPTDSLKSLGFPPNDTTKMLYYNIRVTDILDEEAYTSRMSEERAAAEAKAAIVRERLPEIEKFVDETYRYIASGKAGDNIQTTASGLQYIIHEEGTGAQLNPGDVATVHYYGILKSNGTMFDNSWRRGEEFQFQLGAGQVIRGWDEGVALLKEGSKATLIIPYELGYGANGNPPTIPAESDLIFYIEVPQS